MKFIDEFRDPQSASRLIEKIRAEVDPRKHYRFMEFCGGHTHTISRYGLKDLLPAAVRMIHGPGCPVCVLPTGRIDMAIDLALNHGVTLAIYGDCLRVPGSAKRSLESARALGGRIEVIHATTEVLEIAQNRPHQEIVFLAIGFETTTPATAQILKTARERNLRNLSVFSNHVLTPPAISALLKGPKSGVQLEGIIGPAHVSVIIGTRPYEALVEQHQIPIVVSGFEPLDVLQSIRMLIRQVNQSEYRLENEFTRAVTKHGNLRAQQILSEVFEPRDYFEWRGLGSIPRSGLKLKEAYRDLDAERRFELKDLKAPDHKACECPAILRGTKEPSECKVFGTACTPDTPLGACMVSSEGACAAHYLYGRNPGSSQ